MKWQEFVKDYFTFSRKERIGILIIAFSILFVSFAPKIISSHKEKLNLAKEDTLWISSMKKLEKKSGDESEKIKSPYNPYEEDYDYQYDLPKKNYEDKKTELFYFDPNTLSASGWKKMGLEEKFIQAIQNYLYRGGHFNKPEDLQKIDGLPQSEYERLSPFVQIMNPNVSNNQEDLVSVQTQTESPVTKNSSTRYSDVDINTADTSSFATLPGIGNKLAARIVKFREKLGGFYSIEQIDETYGLPDSTFQKIKPYLKNENSSVKKINTNIATVDELKAHPYIHWSIANAIVEYRKEHGDFSQIQDIKKISAITEELYIKIAPYLSVK